jgi:hypothetical protein
MIARRTDGSAYYAVNATSSTDPKDRLDRKTVLFNDLTAHRTYTILLALHMYDVHTTDLKPFPHLAQTAAEYMQQQGGEGHERTAGDVKIKVLGLRKIEGFDTVGTLTTKPDGFTNEKWYSPELDMDLEMKIHSPQAGDHTSSIGQIRLGEPDASLFQVPAGFTLAPPDPRRHPPSGSSVPPNN